MYLAGVVIGDQLSVSFITDNSNILVIRQRIRVNYYKKLNYLVTNKSLTVFKSSARLNGFANEQFAPNFSAISK